MKIVILAAGKGSRFLPETLTTPKALIKINGSTLIEQTLLSLPESVDEVVIVHKYLGQKIIDHIGYTYRHMKISYVEQGQASGTWAALYSARNLLHSTELFGVFNCDDIFSKEDIERACMQKCPTFGIKKAKKIAAYYGMIFDLDNNFIGFNKHPGIDKKTVLEDWYFTGLYILSPEIFEFQGVVISDEETGLPQTIVANLERYPIKVMEIKEWDGINTPDELREYEEKGTDAK